MIVSCENGLNTRPERPRIMWVPTAILEDATGFEAFHDRFGSRGELTNLRTFPWPPENLRDLVLGQDAICVSGSPVSSCCSACSRRKACCWLLSWQPSSVPESFAHSKSWPRRPPVSGLAISARHDGR